MVLHKHTLTYPELYGSLIEYLTHAIEECKQRAKPSIECFLKVMVCAASLLFVLAYSVVLAYAVISIFQLLFDQYQSEQVFRLIT